MKKDFLKAFLPVLIVVIVVGLGIFVYHNNIVNTRFVQEMAGEEVTPAVETTSTQPTSSSARKQEVSTSTIGTPVRFVPTSPSSTSPHTRQAQVTQEVPVTNSTSSSRRSHAS